jgi:predicted peptidase
MGMNGGTHSFTTGDSPMKLLVRAMTVFTLLAAWVLVPGCLPKDPVSMLGKDGQKGFITKKLVRAGRTRKYSVFIPLHYQPTRKYPVLIFLHGLGESAGGEGDTRNLTVGLAPTIALQKDTFPFICIFPQTDGDWSQDIYGQDVMAELDEVSKAYSVDLDRVTLTGISIGGYGTYIIGSKYAHRFAALVPMATNGSAIHVADRLSKVPVRAYTSKMGDVFANNNDKAMVMRIKTAGGQAEYIETPTEGHNCWDYVYGSGEALSWMLQQRRFGSFGIPQ